MAPFFEDQYAMDLLPSMDDAGRPALVVICKRTYGIDPLEAVATPLEEQPAPTPADEFYDGTDPMASSCLQESDLAPFKRAVDVVVQGTAYAPRGKPSKRFKVGVQIGPLKRELQIVGPRTAKWKPPKKGKIDGKSGMVPTSPDFSDPGAVEEVPLRYEYAYGGMSVLVPSDPELFETIESQRKEEEAAVKQAAKEAEAEAKQAEYDAEKDDVMEGFLDDGADPDSYFTRGDSEHGATTDTGASSLRAGEGTQVLTEDVLAEAQAAVEAELAEDAAQAKADAAEMDEHGVVLSESVRELAKEGDDGADATSQQVDAVQDERWIGRHSEIGEELRQSRGPEVQARNPELPEDWPELSCPSNPVGRGFAISADKRVIEGLQLPLIEEVGAPLKPEDVVCDPARLQEFGRVPAGLGWVGRCWAPRSGYAGMMPEDKESAQKEVDERIAELDPSDPEQRVMIESFLSYEPPMFDSRFYNGAPASMQVSHLKGNEEVTLTNLTPEGTLFFRMPGDYPVVTLDRGRGSERVSLRIDTMMVSPDEGQVSLVWRGHVPYGGPDEIAEYPVLELHARQTTWSEELDSEYEALRTKKNRDEGTEMLDLDEFHAERERLAAEAEEAVGADEATHLDELIDEEGTHMLRDDGDVRVHRDVGWVASAHARMDESLSDEEKAKALSKKAALEKKKAAVADKLAGIQAAEKKDKKKAAASQKALEESLKKKHGLDAKSKKAAKKASAGAGKAVGAKKAAAKKAVAKKKATQKK
jgi:hypothetical protein